MTERVLAGAAVLLAAALPMSAVVAWQAAPPPDPRDARRFTRGLVVILLAAAVLRFLVAPHRIATVWIGYRWTQQVTDLLPLPHYGAGSAAVYWLAFTVLPPDHVSLMWVNAALGVAIVAFAALLVRTLVGATAGLWAGAFTAALPLFVRNDTSDANNVPTLLAVLAGLVAWAGYLRSGVRRDLWASAALGTLAAISRPEWVLLAPLAYLGVAWVMGAFLRLSKDTAFRVALASAAAVVVLQLVHVVASADALASRSSLPGLSWARLQEVPRILVSLDVLVDPGFFAVVLSVLGLAASALPSVRRFAVVAWGLSFANLLAVIVDLDKANVARVQVPTALFACFAAAAALQVLGSKLDAWRPRSARVLAASVAALVAWGSVRPAQVLWAPTNEEEEEQLIRRAIASLPASPVVFAHPMRDDRDTVRDPYGLTHTHFPVYWLRPPFRDDEVVPLGRIPEPAPGGPPVYVLLSYRCHALFRPVAQARPRGEDLWPACAKVRDTWALEKVFEVDAPNHGDVWISYFGDAPSFRLGLYRVTGRRAAGSGSDGATTGSP